MHAPTADKLLQAWESGLEQGPARRAVALLACACEAAPEQLLQLPVGRRDARLFRLRRLLFGERMAALAQCPVCAEQLDVACSVDDICPVAHHDLDDARPAELQVASGSCRMTCRLPNSADLIALTLPDAAPSPAALLRSCLLRAECDGRALTFEQLSPDALSAIGAAMAEADPLAQIELSLHCPACGHGWDDLLDIGAFLWKEVDAWARRTLHDVHTLARAYGWSEADVLSLSARRRSMYLDMVRL
ncbi:hypothetical protein [Massilia sp. CF038]|uniref:T4 family baseplate hub assembly chaperone n=1 Tax=Massilia sp. CF038 TaxID=1881045 RepID=UPI000913DC7D|nr:hypothetical protein [Massilia sp. CF038]SHG51499.1 hypothetical protein SAMN05428948_0814 [Massilia sp. CF038]